MLPVGLVSSLLSLLLSLLECDCGHSQVTFSRNEVSLEQLLESIEDCGFDASVISAPNEKAVTQVQ